MKRYIIILFLLMLVPFFDVQAKNVPCTYGKYTFNIVDDKVVSNYDGLVINELTLNDFPLVNGKRTCPSHIFAGYNNFSSQMFKEKISNKYFSGSNRILLNNSNLDINIDFVANGEFNCNDLAELMDYLNFILKAVQYGTVIIVIILSILDYSKAVVSSESDALAKANKKTIKRLIILVIVLIIRPLMNFVLDLFTDGEITTCGFE